MDKEKLEMWLDVVIASHKYYEFTCGDTTITHLDLSRDGIFLNGVGEIAEAFDLVINIEPIRSQLYDNKVWVDYKGWKLYAYA